MLPRVAKVLPSIALASCAHHPGFIAGDDEALIAAFERAGAGARRARWDDQPIDWASFDAVLIRTTWDYHERLDEFLAWCARVETMTTLLNPLDLIRRNARKTYLRDFEGAGVPIVPTRLIDRHHEHPESTLLEALDESVSSACVIKPIVGAAAMGLLEVRHSNLEESLAHVRVWLDHSPLLVQPLLESIRTSGETSLVMIESEFSHAVRKVPKPGDIRVQIELGGAYSIVEPSRAQLDVAHLAMKAQGQGALYARVDLVDLAPNQPVVMELELIEPELFFAFVEGSGDRMVRATLDRLARARVPQPLE